MIIETGGNLEEITADVVASSHLLEGICDLHQRPGELPGGLSQRPPGIWRQPSMHQRVPCNEAFFKVID